MWEIKLVNNGDHPATNVVVKYSIVIKRSIFEYGYDEVDIINERFVDYKTIDRKFKFDYIPPGSEKHHYILELDGYFPKADLILMILVSTEIDFITQSINLDNHEHPGFNNLADSDHGRRMLGAYEKD